MMEPADPASFRQRALEIFQAWDRIPGHTNKDGKRSPDWRDHGGCPGLTALARVMAVGKDSLRWTWIELSEGPVDPSTGLRDSSKSVIVNVGGCGRKAVWRLK